MYIYVYIYRESERASEKSLQGPCPLQENENFTPLSKSWVKVMSSLSLTAIYFIASCLESTNIIETLNL